LLVATACVAFGKSHNSGVHNGAKTGKFEKKNDSRRYRKNECCLHHCRSAVLQRREDVANGGVGLVDLDHSNVRLGA
jgi:hypothetical protein